MSYAVISRLTGGAPWHYDNEHAARACAEEAAEDGSEWAVVRLGALPSDIELVATYPPEDAATSPEPATEERP